MNKKVLLSFLIISFILANSAFAASSYYVGSIKSDVYHYPSCYWAGEIYPSNLISFDTPEDAIDAGYRPCKVCTPPLSSSVPSPTSEDTDSYNDELSDNSETYSEDTHSLDNDTEVKISKDYSIPDYSNHSQKNSSQPQDKLADISTRYSDSTDSVISVTDGVEPINTYEPIFNKLKNYTEDFEPIIALKILFKLILIVGFVKYFKR
jgi:hypothetical protein